MWRRAGIEWRQRRRAILPGQAAREAGNPVEEVEQARYEGPMDVPSELLRAARVALDIGQRELAVLSGVGQRTILRIEQNDPRVSLETRRRLQDAFEKQGVVFIADDGVSGPGIRVRRSLLQQQNLRF
jgi:DNA-binding XRE family transcriptional regulator